MSNAADIEAQAAAWIARCDGRGGEHDPELAAWLIADPRHRAAYLRLAQAGERTQRLARLRPAGRAIDPDLLAPRRPPHLWARLRRRTSRVANDAAHGARARKVRASLPTLRRSAAGAVGAAMALLVASWNLFPWSSTQSYRTDPDGLSRIILADGSAVTLNANTELRVHFTAARREVTLLRGEAHFSFDLQADRSQQRVGGSKAKSEGVHASLGPPSR